MEKYLLCGECFLIYDNIVIMGYSGSGKTTLAKKLSKQLGYSIMNMERGHGAILMNPYKHTPENTSSLMKKLGFYYLLLDYLLRSWVIVPFKRFKQGVVCDRYYDILLSKECPRLLMKAYWLFPKPTYSILLNPPLALVSTTPRGKLINPEEIIRERKLLSQFPVDTALYAVDYESAYNVALYHSTHGKPLKGGL